MLRKLNSWTSLDMFSCLGGPEVTHTTGSRAVPGSIPSFGKDCYVGFSVLLMCLYFFWAKTHYLSRKFVISFAIYFTIEHFD